MNKSIAKIAKPESVCMEGTDMGVTEGRQFFVRINLRYRWYLRRTDNVDVS